MWYGNLEYEDFIHTGVFIVGRPKAVVDLTYLEDMLLDGVPRKEISRNMGVSPPTLRRIIANAEEKRTLLTQYKTLRNLHLTELEVQVLEAVTPDKIESAGLKDLMFAYKVLRSKEVDDSQEKDGNIKGLIAHLLHLERLERDLGRPLAPEDVQEAEYEEASDPTRDEDCGAENPGNLPVLPDPVVK